MRMTCVGFKSLERGSLQGFADLAMDSGLVLLGCTLHDNYGRRWVNPPGRPQIDSNHKLMLDDGKILYAAIVEFSDKHIRRIWSNQAVAAIEAYRNSKAPASAGAMNTERSGAASQGASA